MGFSDYIKIRLDTSKWCNFSKRTRIFLELNQHCILCRQSSATLICEYCEADINYFEHSKYHYNLLNNIAVNLGLSSVSFDFLSAAAEYHWPLSTLITQLKFAKKSIHARALAQLFCEHGLPPKYHLPQAIIPIPLHKSRLVHREYNQAAIIALEVAKTAKIPCLVDTLLRIKETQPQTDLSATKRRKNTQNAFTINKPLPTTLNHIAVFDDVITTGATISSAVDTLRQAYPEMQIDAWAICITSKNKQT